MGQDEAFKLPWIELKKKMLKKYCSRTEIRKLEDEFHQLVVKYNDLKTYDRKFLELSVLCPSVVPDVEKALEKYVEGLPPTIE